MSAALRPLPVYSIHLPLETPQRNFNNQLGSTIKNKQLLSIDMPSLQY